MIKSETVERQNNRRANWHIKEKPDHVGAITIMDAPPRLQNKKFRTLILGVVGKVNSEE